jgi:GxxExxY protein
MYVLPDERVVERCNNVTQVIIGSAIEVHRHLGAGLLESAYEDCLVHEMKLRDLKVERQLVRPLHYKGLEIEKGYRLDLLVEGLIIVELKACDRIEPIHEKQLQTYLHLSELYLGLILNFRVERLKDGIRRVINPPAGNNLNQLQNPL